MLSSGVCVTGAQGRRWKVSKKLGEGKCCEVYEATLQGEDVKVAARVYKPGFEFVYWREVNILDHVQRQTGTCTQLAGCLEKFHCDGRNFILQELLDLNLSHIQLMTDNQGMSLYIVQKMAHDIAIALKCLHSCGYIHADLKPSNLMWSAQDGCLKLIDFGLSFKVGTQEVGQVQSSCYRAPEVSSVGIDGQTTLTTAIDMWSLGCLLLWIHTNQKMAPPVSQKSGGQEHSSFLSYCNNCKVPDSTQRCEHEVLAKQVLLRFWEGKTEGKEVFLDLISKLIQCKSLKRLTASQVVQHPFVLERLDPDYYDLLLLPTPILRLLNALDDKDLNGPDDEFSDITEDIKEECTLHGTVVTCVLPREGKGRGKVYVQYERGEDSQKAFEKLNGRSFNHRTVITTYYPVHMFLDQIFV